MHEKRDDYYSTCLRQGCLYVHHMVQWCTNLQKKNFFETRCTKFLSFYIVMCTVYSVYLVCTHYGRKMLAALVYGAVNFCKVLHANGTDELVLSSGILGFLFILQPCSYSWPYSFCLKFVSKINSNLKISYKHKKQLN